MKEFRGDMFDNCNCKMTDYKNYIKVYLNYKLSNEIIILFDLYEIRDLDDELK
jgi:hypothetical protein